MALTLPEAELVAVAGRGSLIVVNQDVIRRLPGINIIPFSDNRAFLALDANRGMSDLELAVGDRLAENDVRPRERRALSNLQAQLRAWRKAPSLRFQTKAIVVVERTPVKRSDGTRRTESPMPSRRRVRSAHATTDATFTEVAAGRAGPCTSSLFYFGPGPAV